jgi:hypothetical protein
MSKSSASVGFTRSARARSKGVAVVNQPVATLIVANVGGSSNSDIVLGKANGDNSFADHISVGQTPLLVQGTRDGRRRKAFAVTHSGYNSDKIYLRTLAGVPFMTLFSQDTKGFETDDDFSISGSGTKTYCTVLETFILDE